MLARKTPRKTSFVPRILFRSAVTGAGVIPVCVTAAMASLNPGCGDGLSFGVAEQCFTDGAQPSCGEVPDARADGKAKHDASGHPDALGVADVGFQDAPGDVAIDVVPLDVMTGVAVDAFGGG
jgi:hypothetical protein